MAVNQAFIQRFGRKLHDAFAAKYPINERTIIVSAIADYEGVIDEKGRRGYWYVWYTPPPVIQRDLGTNYYDVFPSKRKRAIAEARKVKGGYEHLAFAPEINTVFHVTAHRADGLNAWAELQREAKRHGLDN